MPRSRATRPRSSEAAAILELGVCFNARFYKAGTNNRVIIINKLATSCKYGLEKKHIPRICFHLTIKPELEAFRLELWVPFLHTICCKTDFRLGSSTDFETAFTDSFLSLQQLQQLTSKRRKKVLIYPRFIQPATPRLAKSSVLVLGRRTLSGNILSSPSLRD